MATTGRVLATEAQARRDEAMRANADWCNAIFERIGPLVDPAHTREFRETVLAALEEANANAQAAYERRCAANPGYFEDHPVSNPEPLFDDDLPGPEDD